jgi:hypothetical protein
MRASIAVANHNDQLVDEVLTAIEARQEAARGVA